MQFEVELKFPLADEQQILNQLTALGAVAKPQVEQADRYFNHPVRDFHVTDEAFRIRSAGDSNCITYKGPVIDTATKMRREIEIPVADGAAAAQKMADLWTSLGFRFVFEVRKTRIPLHLDWNGILYELALDRLSIGSFLEIELIADESQRDQARQSILNLAHHLDLTNPERRSYLELVMTSQS